MKKIFTLLLLTSCWLRSFGQQVLFQQNFESFQGYQIIGWAQQANGYPWETGYADAIGTYCFMPTDNKTKIAGLIDTYVPYQGVVCNGTHSDDSVRLNTPSIDLSGIPGAYLKYDSYFKGITTNGKTESATIEVSLDSGSTWTVIAQAAPDPSGFKTQYADLSQFTGHSGVRIGFCYKDRGEQMGGWMIDNIKVFVPAQTDLLLNYVTPRDSTRAYFATGSVVTHQGQVLNLGIDTVETFTVSYRKGNGPVYAQHFSGLQIPPLGSFSFSHSSPDTITDVSRETVTMWTDHPDDPVAANDTARCSVNGAAFIPAKQLVVEEGTGTWCAWCPRGWSYMNELTGSDLDVCRISIHDGDPMEATDYSDYIFYLDWNYIPYFLLDRRKKLKPDEFFPTIFAEKDRFGYANLHLTGNLTGNSLSMTATVIPAIDLEGDYRLVLVITEDSVRGTTSSYDQKNVFSGGTYGAVGGFENRPNPVPAADMYYNFVARKILPSADGLPGSLPPAMTNNTPYSYGFQTTIDPAWNRERLKASVLLINNADSTILNSRTLPWFLEVKNPETSFLEAGLFPNPAHDETRVFFSLNKSQKLSWTLSDMTGRSIFTSVRQNFPSGRNEVRIPLGGLMPGIYLLSLDAETGRKTLKVEVR